MSRLELEQHLVAERTELNRAIRIDPAKEVVLDKSFRPVTATPSGDGLRDELPLPRLDLIALQHAHQSHDQALRAAVIAQFPPVEVGFHTARDVDGPLSAGAALPFELPFFGRNQSTVARERARRVQVEAECDARLLEARAEVLRTVKELGVVNEQLIAAREASQAAGRLAEQARTAAVSGALSPLLAANILERSYASRRRVLEVEQTVVELQIALVVASETEP